MLALVGCREELTPGGMDERMEEIRVSMSSAADKVEDDMEEIAEKSEERIKDAIDDN